MATLDTILNIQVQGTDSMVKLKTEIDKTSKELKEMQKDGKKASETQEQFNAKVVTAETKLKGMRSELNKSKTELIKNAKAAGDNSKSYDSLVKANAKYSAELRKLADPMGKNNKAFTALSQKMKANTDQLKKMDEAMGRNQRNVGNYKQSLTSVATGIGAVIIAFKTFQRVLSTFTDFQFQMKQVGVISGATNVQLQELTETAKELGRTTAFTAGEVAGLQTELAKLGFNPDEINAMTSSVLDLAFAFDKDLAETGQTVAVVLNSYKLEASEATRVTDILASAFSKTSLDLEKFNTAFPKVGAISKQLGFSLEGTTAMLGALTDAGLEASTAGTSLRSIFLKLADSNSELSKKFGGSVTSIDQLLPALNDLFESGTDVEEMLGLTDKRSVTAFATLASGAPKVETLTKAFKNSAGEAANMAEVMRDSLKGSLDAASSAANGFVIELFEKLEPAITLIIDGISVLFGALTTAIENFKTISIAVGSYAAVVASASIANGTFVSALVATKVAKYAMAAASTVAKVATNAFSTAIKMNPIGLFVSLLTTGIALLWDWSDASNDAAGATNETNKAVKEQIREVNKLDAIRQKSAEQQKSEIEQLKNLRDAIKKGNMTQKERGEAIQKYNDIAGTNISNLSDEERIVMQLESSYENAVNAIKKKIILQSSEEQVIELLEQQKKLEGEIEEQKQRVNDQTEVHAALEKKVQKANQERINAGKRGVDELIEDGNNLIDNTERVTSEYERNAKNFTNFANQQLEASNVVTESININVDARIQQMQTNDELEAQSTAQTLDDTERKITANEDLTLSTEATSEAILQAKEDEGNALNDLTNEQNRLTDKTQEYERIENQIAAIYANKNQALKALNTTGRSGNEVKKTEATLYQQLKTNVSEYTKKLNDAVIQGEIDKQTFLKSNEAKAMSVEERDKRVAQIETQTATKVKAATDKVVKAKQDLIAADKLVDQAMDDVNMNFDDYLQNLRDAKQASDEVVAVDKRQIEQLQKLEDAGANVARERIQLALKVAKAQLSAMLAVAEASTDTTDTQVANINRLKAQIEGFEQQLQDTPTSETGFLNTVLYGSNEDGDALTGEDLINGVQLALGAVSDTMAAFNELQNQRLQTRLGVMTKERDEEVELYKNSAQFEIDTDEQRADKIEAIEKKHDDAMLALKVEQFEKDKKFQKAQAVIGGATAIMNILKGTITGNPLADSIIKGILITAAVVMTKMQIATIDAQPVPTAAKGGVLDDSFFADGGMVVGKSHAQGGEKFRVGGRVAELEGGEAVINKRSTAMFKPILSRINEAGGGKKFANGGTVFADGGMVFDSDTIVNDSFIAESLGEILNDQQVLLVEADVTSSQKSVNTIESRVSF